MELRARPMDLRLVEPPRRSFIAVVGLAPGCGATTLARALAATLARRDHSGVAIVASPHAPVGSSLSSRAALRLAARVNARASGRLCLTSDVDSVPRLAPAVLDLPSTNAAAASAAEIVVLVAPGHTEPALVELAARTHDALTVVTAADDPDRWRGRVLLVLPRSRLGARLANAGWEPRGALGAAVDRIADACEERVCAA